MLFSGVWPSDDVDGTPYRPGTKEHARQGQHLAGGFYGTLWVLKGDLEYFALSLGLEHFGSNTPCFLCQANTSTLPWADCRLGVAGWIPTTWQNAAWEMSRPNRRPLFKVPGVSISSVLPDILHCKHLGSDTYFYASTLTLLTHHMLPGTPENNLGLIWPEIKAQGKVLLNLTQLLVEVQF